VSLFSASDFAHAQTMGSPKQTQTITYHGKTYSAPIGTEIVIPVTSKNGTGTIHFSATLTKKETLSSPAISGCVNASATTNYVDAVGITVMHYTLNQFFCDDGNATITSLSTPQGSGGGIAGVALTSHNEGNNWVSKPFSAQSVGNYTFSLGIPTPWGPVGGNCIGWVRINAFGDGGWTTQAGACA
jgi:hypothetical protein